MNALAMGLILCLRKEMWPREATLWMTRKRAQVQQLIALAIILRVDNEDNPRISSNERHMFVRYMKFQADADV